MPVSSKPKCIPQGSQDIVLSKIKTRISQLQLRIDNIMWYYVPDLKEAVSFTPPRLSTDRARARNNEYYMPWRNRLDGKVNGWEEFKTVQ